MEEEDGYLTGETDPFIMENSEGTVVWPVEETDEREVLPPRDESVESTDVFKEDRLEMLLTEEIGSAPASVATVDPRAVLKGRLEVYILYGVFCDGAGGIGAEDLSGIEPLGTK